MTELEVIRIMRKHLEGLFPKVCVNCGRIYTTLREYILLTRPLGAAMPYDAEEGDWNPLRPLGTMTFANCACGTTLSLSSKGMSLIQLWRLLSWARIETARRAMTPRQLLGYLRDEISAQVLAEATP